MKRFKFFALLALTILTTNSCNKSSDPIFNGKDLSNWNLVVENNAVPGNQVFSTSDGIITIKGDPFGYMYTREKYRNYTLELEYRWQGEASNSGIFLLVESPDNPFPKGVECQLMAGKAGDFVLLNGANLNEYQLPEGIAERPKFPVIEKRETSNEKPTGEWNKVKIIVREGRITVYINNLLQNEATSEVREGYIGLQSEGKEVQFRNLVLK